MPLASAAIAIALSLAGAACASAPAPADSPVDTLKRYVAALERQDYAAAAALLADDGRFGDDPTEVAARLEAAGATALQEARALLSAATADGGAAVTIEEVADLGAGRQARTPVVRTRR